MADTAKLAELLKALAAEGFQYGDIAKAMKGAKEAGVLKSAGRGKQPEDDPLRLAIRDALLKMNVSNGSDINGELVALVSGATAPDPKVEGDKGATSFMITLNDNWKVNFIKSMPKEKKESKEAKKKEAGPATFEEPTVS